MIRSCFADEISPEFSLQLRVMEALKIRWTDLRSCWSIPVLELNVHQLTDIRQCIITETTKKCLEDLEQQWDNLKVSILQLQLERRKFAKEEIVEWITKFKDGNIANPAYRKKY